MTNGQKFRANKSQKYYYYLYYFEHFYLSMAPASDIFHPDEEGFSDSETGGEREGRVF
jgi:hypothetical protein